MIVSKALSDRNKSSSGGRNDRDVSRSLKMHPLLNDRGGQSGNGDSPKQLNPWSFSMVTLCPTALRPSICSFITSIMFAITGLVILILQIWSYTGLVLVAGGVLSAFISVICFLVKQRKVAKELAKNLEAPVDDKVGQITEIPFDTMMFRAPTVLKYRSCEEAWSTPLDPAPRMHKDRAKRKEYTIIAPSCDFSSIEMGKPPIRCGYMHDKRERDMRDRVY
ncbi:uncharacterized protein LOC100182822 [Ciona intestinalis]